MASKFLTAAELKTIRESCGLTVPDFASLVGVDERTLRYWESGKTAPKTADIYDLLLGVNDRIEVCVAQAVQQVKAIIAAHGKPAEIALLRYRENADLWHYLPDWRPLPCTCHGAMLARTRSALADLHVATKIVYLDVPRYVAWLNGRADNSALRAEWAGLQ